MRRISWKNFLEGIGVLALVASLLFVGFQLQQDRDLAAAQVIVDDDAVRSELLTAISDNRTVWLRGLKGEELTPTDEIAFRAVAVALYHKHSGVYLRLQLLGYGTPESVAQQYAFDLYQYPSLRRIFIQEGQLIDARIRYFNRVPNPGFRAKVTELLGELDNVPPEIQERTFFPY